MQQKWILWLGKTRMAELGVCWNDLTPENIGIIVITEKSGEVSFLHGERIWQLFPPINGLTMYSVLVVGFVDERISMNILDLVEWVKTMAGQHSKKGVSGVSIVIRINLMHDR